MDISEDTSGEYICFNLRDLHTELEKLALAFNGTHGLQCSSPNSYNERHKHVPSSSKRNKCNQGLFDERKNSAYPDNKSCIDRPDSYNGGKYSPESCKRNKCNQVLFDERKNSAYPDNTSCIDRPDSYNGGKYSPESCNDTCRGISSSKNQKYKHGSWPDRSPLQKQERRTHSESQAEKSRKQSNSKVKWRLVVNDCKFIKHQARKRQDIRERCQEDSVHWGKEGLNTDVPCQELLPRLCEKCSSQETTACSNKRPSDAMSAKPRSDETCKNSSWSKGILEINCKTSQQPDRERKTKPSAYQVFNKSSNHYRHIHRPRSQGQTDCEEICESSIGPPTAQKTQPSRNTSRRSVESSDLSDTSCTSEETLPYPKRKKPAPTGKQNASCSAKCSGRQNERYHGDKSRTKPSKNRSRKPSPRGKNCPPSKCKSEDSVECFAHQPKRIERKTGRGQEVQYLSEESDCQERAPREKYGKSSRKETLEKSQRKNASPSRSDRNNQLNCRDNQSRRRDDQSRSKNDSLKSSAQEPREYCFKRTSGCTCTANGKRYRRNSGDSKFDTISDCNCSKRRETRSHMHPSPRQKRNESRCLGRQSKGDNVNCSDKEEDATTQKETSRKRNSSRHKNPPSQHYGRKSASVPSSKRDRYHEAVLSLQDTELNPEWVICFVPSENRLLEMRRHRSIDSLEWSTPRQQDRYSPYRQSKRLSSPPSQTSCETFLCDDCKGKVPGCLNREDMEFALSVLDKHIHQYACQIKQSVSLALDGAPTNKRTRFF